jgi:hypothetical protein
MLTPPVQDLLILRTMVYPSASLRALIRRLWHPLRRHHYGIPEILKRLHYSVTPLVKLSILRIMWT